MGHTSELKRTHISIPKDLADEIDKVAGARGRSSFLIDAARRELTRLRQVKALDAAVGAWADEEHPELRGGSARWVRRLRREGEVRYQREVKG